MAARVIDGAAVAARLRAGIAAEAAALAAGGMVPGLAVVLVGDDPASEIYVGGKIRATRAAGLASFEHRLPRETSEGQLLALLDRLNRDGSVHGILVQLPLPAHIDAARVIEAVSPEKDVDGLHPLNAGRLASGLPGLVPCTPQGAMILIREVLPEVAGGRAVVLGRSNLFGKPMAQLLLAADATVTVAHSRSRDPAALCREADILVAAVGRPALVQADWVKPGAVVIDVGINRVPLDPPAEGRSSRLVGDVADEVWAVAGAVTPVPGGVGPMTIACLLMNTLAAARASRR